MNKLKELQEQRAEMVSEMEKLMNLSKDEKRSLNEEELNKFNELDKEINNIDATLEAEKRAQSLVEKEPVSKGTENVSVEEAEQRAFEDEIRNINSEQRANLSKADNGVIIPTTIAQRIIQAVNDICPVVARATIFMVGGKLIIPTYGPDQQGNDVTVAYGDEFVEPTPNSGVFGKVELNAFLGQALSLVSKALISNTNFDVTTHIVNVMAEKIARFLERECLIGTTDKAQGITTTTNVVNAASASAIDVDDLIDIQASVKQAYQKDACWTMHPDTFKLLCKLKDGDQRPLVMHDYSTQFPHTILGKPVYLSDNMQRIGAGNVSIVYGDYKGLALKFSKNIEIQLLREKYATQYAVGVLGTFEFDCKVQNPQMLAAFKHPGA